MGLLKIADRLLVSRLTVIARLHEGGRLALGGLLPALPGVGSRAPCARRAFGNTPP